MKSATIRIRSFILGVLFWIFCIMTLARDFTKQVLRPRAVRSQTWVSRFGRDGLALKLSIRLRMVVPSGLFRVPAIVE